MNTNKCAIFRHMLLVTKRQTDIHEIHIICFDLFSFFNFSFFVLSCLVLSCLVLSFLVLSCLVLTGLSWGLLISFCLLTLSSRLVYCLSSRRVFIVSSPLLSSLHFSSLLFFFVIDCGESASQGDCLDVKMASGKQTSSSLCSDNGGHAPGPSPVIPSTDQVTGVLSA